MEKRDILNHLGEKIGDMELPTGTPEQVWEAKLSPFAAPPRADRLPDVTPRQMRQALVLSGISIATVESALNTLPEPLKELALIEWEYSTVFVRTNALVDQLGDSLGWTSEQLDNLWRFAETL
jgi:hypothetical protein